MSIKYHDQSIAGTPELATVVQAGNDKPVTSGAVKSALDALPVSGLSSSSVLLNEQIAVSGTSSWQTETYTVDLSSCKKIMLFIGFHGALANSAVYDVTEVKVFTSANHPAISVYWDSSDVAQASIYTLNGIATISVTAKTNSFALDILVLGLS